jgi:uncharacterized protein (TIGR02147 family)
MKQNIFNYSDYRTFLRDHVQTQKESKPLWSLGQWSRRLEFANTSVLTNILNGVRHPGQNIVERFVDYFQFSDEENNYFRNLVRLQKKYSDPELRVLIMEKLKNSHPEKKFKLLDDETFQMISKWHYYAIRELVNLSDFKEDITWIRARLKFDVTIVEIKKALKDLERLGLLARNKSGRLIYAGGSVRSSSDVAVEGLKRLHEEMISIARESIRITDVLDRDITGITFSMKKENLPKVKELIRQFRLNISKNFESLGAGEDVYQMNIQFIPLTKNKEQL